MIHKISILIVLAYILVAILWDVIVVSLGYKHATFCQAVRDLNRDSDGLLGLCLVALVVHILCLQWFPNSWVHQ